LAKFKASEVKLQAEITSLNKQAQSQKQQILTQASAI
jgi:hypothetical protein